MFCLRADVVYHTAAEVPYLGHPGTFSSIGSSDEDVSLADGRRWSVVSPSSPSHGAQSPGPHTTDHYPMSKIATATPYRQQELLFVARQSSYQGGSTRLLRPGGNPAVVGTRQSEEEFGKMNPVRNVPCDGERRGRMEPLGDWLSHVFHSKAEEGQVGARSGPWPDRPD